MIMEDKCEPGSKIIVGGWLLGASLLNLRRERERTRQKERERGGGERETERAKEKA